MFHPVRSACVGLLQCQSEARVRLSAFTALISGGTGEGGAEGVEQTGGEESPGQTASQLMKQVCVCVCVCVRECVHVCV